MGSVPMSSTCGGWFLTSSWALPKPDVPCSREKYTKNTASFPQIPRNPCPFPVGNAPTLRWARRAEDTLPLLKLTYSALRAAASPQVGLRTFPGLVWVSFPLPWACPSWPPVPGLSPHFTCSCGSGWD